MVKKLPEVCDIQYGFPFDSKEFNSSEGMPLIRIRDVVRGYSETYTTEEFNKEYVVHEGEILVGMDGEFNIARWGRVPALLNQRVCKLSPKGIDGGYLFYFMPSALKKIEGKTSFVTVKHLSAKELNKIEIPVPDPKEQCKIARTLDLVSKVIGQRKQELDWLDDLIKSRFIELFGDPKVNPKQYPVSELSEYIEFLTSGSRGWAKYCTDAGTEWFITIKNVKDCRISTDNMQPVSAPDNAEAKRTKVQEGDLLISITADLGRTGVVTREIAEHGAYINQHLTCIRLNKEILNPLYAAYFMESAAGKEQFESRNQSAVKAGLNFNSINSLRIMVPPMSVQKEFISFVAQVDKSKLAVQQSLQELETLKKSLMQQYFG